MPDESSLLVPENDGGGAGEPPVDWEVPEVAAVAVLVAVGLLVLGGLATGIAAASGASGSIPPGAGVVVAGSSIQTGAAWAEPLLAILLLGVLGLCWWQVDGWSDASEDTESSEVAGHLRRGRQIAVWVQGALILTLAGSASLFAGMLLVNSYGGNRSSLIWSRDLYQAASLLAVAALVSGGLWIGTRLRVTADDGTLA